MKHFKSNGCTPTRLLVLLGAANLLLANENWFGLPKDLTELKESRRGVNYDIVVPWRVDDAGNRLTHLIGEWPFSGMVNDDEEQCYKFFAFDQLFHLCVKPNVELFSPEFIVQTNGKDGQSRIDFKPRKCYYRGTLINVRPSEVAISVCNGMSGIVIMPSTEILIERLQAKYYGKFNVSGVKGTPHIVYRHLLPDDLSGGGKEGARFCEVSELPKGVAKRNRTVRNVNGGGDAGPLVEHPHIELMVVADHRMIQQQESVKKAEEYILTVMNIVDSLFSDDDNGLGLKISVVRLKMLTEKDGFDLTEKADPGVALQQFQKWQEKFNAAESHTDHFDASVLLTGSRLCRENCNTLGRADIQSMCIPSRSAVVARDGGLPTAFVVAHELGHALSMKHDGQENSCSRRNGFVMSDVSAGRQNMFRWSDCSRKYLKDFLRIDQASCLSNWPNKETLVRRRARLPGEIYSVDDQCRLLVPGSEGLCSGGNEEICSNLRCQYPRPNNTKCFQRLAPAADGTPCEFRTSAIRKICWKGKCIPRPQPVNGEWSVFFSDGECSTTCGGGIKRERRHCNSPAPKFGGLYCEGSNEHYVVCNTKPCPGGKSTRQAMCHSFDRSYVPVIRTSPEQACDLVCRNKKTDEEIDMIKFVPNGTPCSTNDTYHRCVNGQCQIVGCDNILKSTQVLDKCGKCNGDGSSCKTITKTFSETFTKSGYNHLFSLKKDMREIRATEVTASPATYFALRTAERKLILDGRKADLQSVVYKGLHIRYRRLSGQLETIETDGALSGGLNFGVTYDADAGLSGSSTIKLTFNRGKSKQIVKKASWRTEKWKPCSVTCGVGEQKRSLRCYSTSQQREVSHKHCRARVKPNTSRRCRENSPCKEVKWIAEKWTVCDSSCKQKSRRVDCYEVTTTDPLSGKVLSNDKCDGLDKPSVTKPCSLSDCKPDSCIDMKSYCSLLLTLPSWKDECRDSQAIRSVCCKTCSTEDSPPTKITWASGTSTDSDY